MIGEVYSNFVFFKPSARSVWSHVSHCIELTSLCAHTILARAANAEHLGGFIPSTGTRFVGTVFYQI